jgi:phosphopantothenoylcysteine decarboxylase/phosphopantothenate--cysteine ligase
MSEPEQIVAALRDPPLPAAGRLRGRRVLITAGPTLEDIDPVRFLGNRSSGKMGFAVAAAARAEGAEVTLVAGPVALPTPDGVSRIDVRSAQAMHTAVFTALPGQQLFIAAAAVADYRPVETLDRKRKKSGERWSIDLVLNPDILAEVAAQSPRPFIVGFAAETNDVEQHARDKLRRKRLDMIAANHVGRPGCGFESCDNALSVYWEGGGREIALADKSAVAAQLVACIAERLASCA